MSAPYDAILLLSFGGPEAPDEVMPFLENVLRGRNIPEARKLEVAHHYELLGGVSPINAQNRALLDALRRELKARGPDLPVYWGNRNWRPFLADTLREMRSAGVRRFLTFVTSAFSSYSGCRQYREDIQAAQRELGPDAPQADKIRVFFNHPDFIAVTAENWAAAAQALPADRRAAAMTLFTAHSIPLAMAKHAPYEAQLREACELAAAQAAIPRWRLVYQSRSGSPHQPWLEPDVCDALRELRAAGERDVIVLPIGFISDHMEVIYDLDHEAKALCDELGLNLVRAATPGVHPRFIAMIRELILERVDPSTPKRTLGARGPKEDVCPATCCLSGREEHPGGGRPAHALRPA